MNVPGRCDVSPGPEKENEVSTTRIGALIAVVTMLGLGVPSESRGEETLPMGFNINCGGNCDDVLAKTRPGSFISAVPGGVFVITVAHVAPSPEDAMDRGVPATCESVRFRVDTLKVKTAAGLIEVGLGTQQSIAPGQATQIRYEVDPSSGTGLPTYDLDLVGFRLRSDKAVSRCSIVASGLFYPDRSTVAPIPVALLPSISPARSGR